MKTLIILRGIPGCGKSTFGKLIKTMWDMAAYSPGPLPSGDCVVCSADNYFMKNDEYQFDPSKLGAAHGQAQNTCRRAMEDETPLIIIDNTNTTEREMKPYQEMAEEHGYTVFSIIVENRHDGKNVHGVPPEAIDRMISRFNVRL